MDGMDGMAQMWQNREDLLGGLGDDDDADAFNDETFGDGGWDDPGGVGDISDLSAMTLDKAGILQEAAQLQGGGSGAGGGLSGSDGADFAFPSLPIGDNLLGGPAKPLTSGLLTPQMMMQSAADSKDKKAFFSSAANDLPVSGAPRPGSGGPVGGGGGGVASRSEWPLSMDVSNVGMRSIGPGVEHGNQGFGQQQQQQQQQGYAMPNPQAGIGGGKVMSLADIEAMMMRDSKRNQQQEQFARERHLAQQQQQQQQIQPQHPHPDMPPHMVAAQHQMMMGLLRQEELAAQHSQHHHASSAIPQPQHAAPTMPGEGGSGVGVLNQPPAMSLDAIMI